MYVKYRYYYSVFAIICYKIWGKTIYILIIVLYFNYMKYSDQNTSTTVECNNAI